VIPGKPGKPREKVDVFLRQHHQNAECGLATQRRQIHHVGEPSDRPRACCYEEERFLGHCPPVRPIGSREPSRHSCQIILQRLWQLSADWDTPLNENEGEELSLYRSRLMSLKVEVNRSVVPHECQTAYFIGFSYIWWHGPAFLKQKEELWPPVFTLRRDEPLPKTKTIITQQEPLEEPIPLLTNCSRFPKMQQILAWVTLFATNARKPKEQREFGNLKPAELRAGLNGAVRCLQSTFFAAETRLQQANHAVKSTSRVQNLNVSTNDQRI
jgi:Pao retrotransposon peptidase